MRVGLMVPCYVDMFYPQVGVATIELLEKLGIEADYPFDQTCCGQAMANSGAFTQAKATEELFVRNFAGYEHIVAPSGSCVHHIRNKFTAAEDTPERRHVSSHVWDLPEFLCDVLNVQDFPWAEFPHEVALHVSCCSLLTSVEHFAGGGDARCDESSNGSVHQLMGALLSDAVGAGRV